MRSPPGPCSVSGDCAGRDHIRSGGHERPEPNGPRRWLRKTPWQDPERNPRVTRLATPAENLEPTLILLGVDLTRREAPAEDLLGVVTPAR